MEDKKILELLAAMIKSEAVKVMQQRLDHLQYQIQSVIDSLGQDAPDELKSKLVEITNKLVVIQAGDAEPDEMDVIAVIRKIIGWIWVNQETLVRVGD